MIEIYEATTQPLMASFFLFPLLAVALGIFNKFKLLLVGLSVQILLTITISATLYLLVEYGRYPNSTGMEGIALFVIPAICFGSILASICLYKLAGFIRQRIGSSR